MLPPFSTLSSQVLIILYDYFGTLSIGVLNISYFLLIFLSLILLSMKLDYVLIDKNHPDINKTKHLFEHAFPIEERPPFNIFINFKKQELYNVYLNDEFVGLVDLVIKDDIIYLFFLAVKKKYRYNGIGSQILHDLQDKYINYNIFLLAEEVNDKYIDNINRINRLKFYERNGFIISSTIITEYDIRYQVLYNKKEVYLSTFLAMMEYLLEDYYQIYKSYVY